MSNGCSARPAAPRRRSSSPSIDPARGAMLARNAWNAGVRRARRLRRPGGRQTSWTGDRREFIGRNGTLARPGRRWPRTRAVGRGRRRARSLRRAADDASSSRRTAAAEIVFFLGDAADATEARAPDRPLPRRRSRRRAGAGRASIGTTLLGAVQVKTPDRSMDIMLNGWLLYQTLACRVWARSAFYQASGAYGFRDQLQDGMALAAVRPRLTREHLLRAAAPPVRRGRRPALVAAALGPGRAHADLRRPRLAGLCRRALCRGVTGDAAVLDEIVPFLDGPALDAGEQDASSTPAVSDETATLFEHCARALDASLALGGHGLPLIGGGDWNDGMNRVGEGGQGESVWLGWLLLRRARPPSRRSPTRAATRTRAALARRTLRRWRRARTRGLGRRLVSARLVRRRHSARLGDERRVPHRFDRAVLGRDLRRGRSASAPPGPWRRSSAS